MQLNNSVNNLPTVNSAYTRHGDGVNGKSERLIELVLWFSRPVQGEVDASVYGRR
jgi:hypothetical protein